MMLMLKEKRLMRYMAKLEHVKKRLQSINKWLPELRKNIDEKTILATLKAYQETIDNIMDIIAMMCKDNGIPPEDDAYNLKRLAEKMIITIKDAEILNKADNLRNKIVREPTKIVEEDVIREIGEVVEDLPEVIKVIEAWLEKQKQSTK